jgi:hypothetical protein
MRDIGRICGLLLALAVCHAGCSARSKQNEGGSPSTTNAAAPKPSQALENRGILPPPPLTRAEDVPAFVTWAAGSTVREREVGRTAILSARDNPAVIEGLIDEIERSRSRDHSRTLVALAVLGEMRSPRGEEFLTEFVNRPLPETGTVVDGEIIEQTALATLQAKAVDGLAYMRSPRADAEILRLAGSHPSRIVRAEAINAYLFNRNDSAEARRALARSVREDEQILIDRVRRNPGEGKESFNRKVAAFLKAHPEVQPPAPERGDSKEGSRDEISAPPSF